MLNSHNNNNFVKREVDQLGKKNDPPSKKSKLNLPSSINCDTSEETEPQNMHNQLDEVPVLRESSVGSTVGSVACFLREERLTREFCDYYLQLMEKHDLMEMEMDKKTKKCLKKEFMHECALLVIGYFNHYLNNEKVVYGEAAVVEDDGKMMWHAKLINSGGFGSLLKLTKRNMSLIRN